MLLTMNQPWAGQSLLPWMEGTELSHTSSSVPLILPFILSVTCRLQARGYL